MDYSQTNVVGTVQFSDGTLPSGGKVTARLNAYDIEVPKGFVASNRVEATIGNDGTFELPLWPNTRGYAGTSYEVKASAPNGQTMFSGTVVVPETERGTVELNAIWGTAPDGDVELMGRLIETMANYRDDTIEAMGQVRQYARTARSSASGAQASERSADNDRQAAETARDAAQESQNAAATAANSANSSERSAADSEQQAKAALTQARGYSQSAGSFRDAAQAAAGQSQTAAGQAEQSEAASRANADRAGDSASDSLRYSNDARTQASRASSSRDSAQGYASQANSSAARASTSETRAGASATAAAASASEAGQHSADATAEADRAAQELQDMLAEYGIGSNVNTLRTSQHSINQLRMAGAQYAIDDDNAETPFPNTLLFLGVQIAPRSSYVMAQQVVTSPDGRNIAVRSYDGSEWSAFDVRLRNGRVPAELVPNYSADKIVSGTFDPDRIPNIPADRANADPAGTAQALIDALIGGAPEALNTLNELAEAFGNDPDFAANVTNALAQKLDKDDFTADAIMKMVRNNGGAGSGIDADTFRGRAPSQFEPAGTGAAIMASHRRATSPHPQYVMMPAVNDRIALALAGFNPGGFASDAGEDAQLMNWSGL